MPPEDLVEVTYISAATQPLAPDALRGLLVAARTKNRRRSITGLLLHVDGSFLQILEGRRADVEALLAEISGDARHHRMLRMFSKSIAARSFGDWSMGFVEPDRQMRTSTPGFSTFLDAAEGKLAEDVAERVREVVSQFRAGRWRQFVK